MFRIRLTITTLSPGLRSPDRRSSGSGVSVSSSSSSLSSSSGSRIVSITAHISPCEELLEHIPLSASSVEHTLCFVRDADASASFRRVRERLVECAETSGGVWVSEESTLAAAGVQRSVWVHHLSPSTFPFQHAHVCLVRNRKRHLLNRLAEYLTHWQNGTIFAVKDQPVVRDEETIREEFDTLPRRIQKIESELGSLRQLGDDFLVWPTADNTKAPRIAFNHRIEPGDPYAAQGSSQVQAESTFRRVQDLAAYEKSFLIPEWTTQSRENRRVVLQNKFLRQRRITLDEKNVGRELSRKFSCNSVFLHQSPGIEEGSSLSGLHILRAMSCADDIRTPEAIRDFLRLSDDEFQDYFFAVNETPGRLQSFAEFSLPTKSNRFQFPEFSLESDSTDDKLDDVTLVESESILSPTLNISIVEPVSRGGDCPSQNVDSVESDKESSQSSSWKWGSMISWATRSLYRTVQPLASSVQNLLTTREGTRSAILRSPSDSNSKTEPAKIRSALPLRCTVIPGGMIVLRVFMEEKHSNIHLSRSKSQLKSSFDRVMHGSGGRFGSSSNAQREFNSIMGLDDELDHACDSESISSAEEELESVDLDDSKLPSEEFLNGWEVAEPTDEIGSLCANPCWIPRDGCLVSFGRQVLAEYMLAERSAEFKFSKELLFVHQIVDFAVIPGSLERDTLAGTLRVTWEPIWADPFGDKPYQFDRLTMQLECVEAAELYACIRSQLEIMMDRAPDVAYTVYDLESWEQQPLNAENFRHVRLCADIFESLLEDEYAGFALMEQWTQAFQLGFLFVRLMHYLREHYPSVMKSGLYLFSGEYSESHFSLCCTEDFVSLCSLCTDSFRKALCLEHFSNLSDGSGNLSDQHMRWIQFHPALSFVLRASAYHPIEIVFFEIFCAFVEASIQRLFTLVSSRDSTFSPPDGIAVVGSVFDVEDSFSEFVTQYSCVSTIDDVRVANSTSSGSLRQLPPVSSIPSLRQAFGLPRYSNVSLFHVQSRKPAFSGDLFTRDVDVDGVRLPHVTDESFESLETDVSER